MDNNLSLSFNEQKKLHEKEREYITVLLLRDPKQVQKTFRCTSDGQILFTHYSTVKIIVEGRIIEADHQPIEILCRRCGIMYRIERE